MYMHLYLCNSAAIEAEARIYVNNKMVLRLFSNRYVNLQKRYIGTSITLEMEKHCMRHCVAFYDTKNESFLGHWYDQSHCDSNISALFAKFYYSLMIEEAG